MDQQALIEYCQLLSTQRTQLELEILKLRKEINELRSKQAQEKEEVKAQDGVLTNAT